LNLIRKKNTQEFKAILTPEQQPYLEQFKIDLQQIKQTKLNLNRKNHENKNREEFLEN